jgi:hypothetical protein
VTDTNVIKLFGSHHPLREALLKQTGAIEQERTAFLQKNYNDAIMHKIICWDPVQRSTAVF